MEDFTIERVMDLDAMGALDEFIDPVDYPIDTLHEGLAGDPVVQAEAMKVAVMLESLTAPMARAALSMARNLVDARAAMDEINNPWEAMPTEHLHRQQTPLED